MRTLLPVLAIALAASPVAAQEGDIVEMTVDYSDLDLDNPADVAELGARIETTARKTCAYEARYAKTFNSVDEDCAQDLVAAALAELEGISPPLAFAN